MRRGVFLLLVTLASAFPAVAARPPAGEAAGLSRLTRVTQRLTRAVSRLYPGFRPTGGRFRLSISNETQLNAAAYPDGRIVVTRGMMAALANRPDDELAAVLGHEITHVAQGHHARTQRTALAGALVGALLGKAMGKDGTAVQQGASLGASLSSAAYSRDDEYRADTGSVRLLHQAGYDPYAMARVLELLKQKSGRGTAKVPVVGWFASHPDTEKRIENARQAARAVSGPAHRAPRRRAR